MKDNSRINIDIGEERRDWLKRKAFEDDKTITCLIKELIDKEKEKEKE